MVERLMQAQTDPESGPGFIDQIKKWGGRVVFAGLSFYYADAYWQHYSNDKASKKSKEDNHHEHQETPENYDQ